MYPLRVREETMRLNRKGHLVWLCVTFVMATQPLAGHISAESAHRVKAKLIRRESAIHTSISNRDEYLLRVIPHRGVAFSAIAIDSYPGYAEPLPIDLFANDLLFSISLVRTPYCDRPAREDPQEVIRCFAIDRRGLESTQTECGLVVAMSLALIASRTPRQRAERFVKGYRHSKERCIP